MLHANDAISFRGGRRVFHSTVLAALTMAAMLLCLLAVHSAGTGTGQGHGSGHSPSAATSGSATPALTSAAETAATMAEETAATTVATTSAMAAGAHSTATHTASSATAATTAVAVLAAGVISNVGVHGASDLAALSMTCSLLLVLGGLVLLSRRPSVCRRLPEVVGIVVGSCRDIPLHLHRPSLTLLSISRI